MGRVEQRASSNLVRGVDIGPASVEQIQQLDLALPSRQLNGGHVKHAHRFQQFLIESLREDTYCRFHVPVLDRRDQPRPIVLARTHLIIIIIIIVFQMHALFPMRGLTSSFCTDAVIDNG